MLIFSVIELLVVLLVTSNSSSNALLLPGGRSLNAFGSHRSPILPSATTIIVASTSTTKSIEIKQDEFFSAKAILCTIQGAIVVVVFAAWWGLRGRVDLFTHNQGRILELISSMQLANIGLAGAFKIAETNGQGLRNRAMIRSEGSQSRASIASETVRDWSRIYFLTACISGGASMAIALINNKNK
jgi:hypothetical protein